MRVAHYMPGYPGCDGSSAFCRGLSRAMNRLFPESCFIVHHKDSGDHPDDLVSHYPGKTLIPFLVPSSLRRALRKDPGLFDGVVLHGTYNPHMVGMAFFLRRLGIPYLFIPHDPYPPGLRYHHRWRKAIFWRLFEKPMIEGAAAMQLLDESHEKFVRDLGCKVPTFVQPNGCEVEALELLPDDLHQPGVRKRLRIQYLGRMDRNHKGLDLLIRAFAEVVKKHDVDLWLIGNDWHDRGVLETLAANLGLAGKVFFKGRRPEPSIQLQGDADLCVLTSRFDGFGLTIVEAMLAKRPVLVSCEAGVATHVRNAGGGWVVEPEVAAIARGFEEALGQRELWPELGAKNQAYVLEHLTWEQVARSTYQEYERVFLGK